MMIMITGKILQIIPIIPTGTAVGTVIIIREAVIIIGEIFKTNGCKGMVVIKGVTLIKAEDGAETEAGVQAWVGVVEVGVEEVEVEVEVANGTAITGTTTVTVTVTETTTTVTGMVTDLDMRKCMKEMYDTEGTGMGT